MAKSKLSKHILEMKFMQRTAERVQKEEFQEEQQRHIDDEHWVLDVESLKEKQNRYVLEPSFFQCEELQFGRMSFKGFNPEIERLHQALTTEEEGERSDAREKESMVGDSEMARRFESLVGTIGNKFKRKRDRVETEEDQKPPETTAPVDEDDAEERCKRLLDHLKNSKKFQFMKPSDD